MPEFFQHIAWPLLAGLGFSVVIDWACTPVRASFWQRPPRTWFIHVALMTLAFCSELLVFQRPLFAFTQMLVLQGVVHAVSAVKMASMREPFVFQDFEYFIDMLRHPRLYIPFFGIGKLLAILLGVGFMIYGSTCLEANLASHLGLRAFVSGWLVLTAVALLLLWAATRRPFVLSFDPLRDMQALGMSGNLAAYAVAENATPLLQPRFASLPLPDDKLQNIVVVQSESFFDARRLYADIHPDVYAWFDTIRQQSVQSGLLTVPACGANTVRTEFAFLSGLADEAIGVHRFNPYRKLPYRGVQTLAHCLRTAGYRTVCVHPYAGSFYQRDKVLPRFGFDEFIDIRAFDKADCCGPFVGDPAVAGKVASLLAEESSRPLFVFVITMENHGPLHLERVTPEEERTFYQGTVPSGFNELSVYLRHVRNAGAMLDILRHSLSTQDRAGSLCWYGDHVPIMPAVFANRKFEDPRTDYFIWNSASSVQPQSTELAATDLAACLLGSLKPS